MSLRTTNDGAAGKMIVIALFILTIGVPTSMASSGTVLSVFFYKFKAPPDNLFNEGSTSGGCSTFFLLRSPDVSYMDSSSTQETNYTAGSIQSSADTCHRVFSIGFDPILGMDNPMLIAASQPWMGGVRLVIELRDTANQFSTFHFEINTTLDLDGNYTARRRYQSDGAQLELSFRAQGMVVEPTTTSSPSPSGLVFEWTELTIILIGSSSGAILLLLLLLCCTCCILCCYVKRARGKLRSLHVSSLNDYGEFGSRSRANTFMFTPTVEVNSFADSALKDEVIPESELEAWPKSFKAETDDEEPAEETSKERKTNDYEPSLPFLLTSQTQKENKPDVKTEAKVQAADSKQAVSSPQSDASTVHKLVSQIESGKDSEKLTPKPGISPSPSGSSLIQSMVQRIEPVEVKPPEIPKLSGASSSHEFSAVQKLVKQIEPDSAEKKSESSKPGNPKSAIASHSSASSVQKLVKQIEPGSTAEKSPRAYSVSAASSQNSSSSMHKLAKQIDSQKVKRAEFDQSKAKTQGADNPSSADYQKTKRTRSDVAHHTPPINRPNIATLQETSTFKKQPLQPKPVNAPLPKESSSSSVYGNQLQPSDAKKATKSPRPTRAIILPSPGETAADTYESILPSPTSNAKEKGARLPRASRGVLRISLPSSGSVEGDAYASIGNQVGVTSLKSPRSPHRISLPSKAGDTHPSTPTSNKKEDEQWEGMDGYVHVSEPFKKKLRSASLTVDDLGGYIHVTAPFKKATTPTKLKSESFQKLPDLSPPAIPPKPQPATEMAQDELYECPDTKPPPPPPPDELYECPDAESLPQSDELYECPDNFSLQANDCYQLLSPNPGRDNIAMQPNVVYDMSTTSDQPQECELYDTIN